MFVIEVDLPDLPPLDQLRVTQHLTGAMFVHVWNLVNEQ
jgi:hypothetical protein